MSNEIQKFDLSDAAKQLREKIRSAFVELIPPEQWEAMVKAELEGFVKGGGGRRSEFSVIAEELYCEHVKQLVKAELQKPEWQSSGYDYENGRSVPRLADEIKKWLTEHRDALLEATLRTMFGGVAQEMLSHLRSRTY